PAASAELILDPRAVTSSSGSGDLAGGFGRDGARTHLGTIAMSQLRVRHERERREIFRARGLPLLRRPPRAPERRRRDRAAKTARGIQQENAAAGRFLQEDDDLAPERWEPPPRGGVGSRAG